MIILTMPKKKTSDRVKNREQYERLREQGMSKQKAARIANSGKEASKKGGKSEKYENWSKKDLVEKAKQVGIENYSSKNKKELIYALRNN
jgi:hypothetical protein